MACGSRTVKTVRPGSLATCDRAAVRGDHRVHDRQPQPGAAGVPGAGGVAAGEALEHVRAQRRRDAGAVVDDLEHRPAALGPQPGGRRRPARGCGCARWPAGWPAPGAAGPRRRAPRTGVVGQVEPPAVAGAGRVGVADRVDDQRGQVDRSSCASVAAGVQPGQQQQVLDQRRTSAAPRTRPGAARARRRSGTSLPLAAHQLGVAADRGQRGAQLVAGVGDELAHLRLGLPAGRPARRSTWSSIRFSAAPTWPTSVRGSVSSGGTRSASRTSPLDSGSSATRVAVAATRCSGRSVRRITRTPASAAATRASSADDQPRRRPAGSSVVAAPASGSPVTSTSPSGAGARPAGSRPGAAEVARCAARRPAAGRPATACCGAGQRHGLRRSAPQHAGVGDDRRRPRAPPSVPSPWPRAARKSGRRRRRRPRRRSTRAGRRSPGASSAGPSRLDRGVEPAVDLTEQLGAQRGHRGDADQRPARPPAGRRTPPAAGPAATAGRRSAADRRAERRRTSGRGLEHVAGAAQRVDHRRAAGVDLLAQVGDVELDDVGLAAEVVAATPGPGSAPCDSTRLGLRIR